MKTYSIFSVLLYFVSIYLGNGQAFLRKFPSNFKFGVSTAAYQIEGAWNVSDKAESIWDRWSHTPDKIIDNTTGDVACDSYHKYKRDVQMIKEMNLDYYKFSLSWGRLFPDSKFYNINMDAVNFYDKLIDELIENDIAPHVTLYHFDLPQIFQDMGGWENPDMADYFVEYAHLAFVIFGNKVKHWITFNEPARFCYGGYGSGAEAPGVSRSGIAEYKCGHNVLRAHAKAYRLYKSKAKEDPRRYNGKVTIVLNGNWVHPETDSAEDYDAAETYMQFETGWFANPIFGAGNYPSKMIEKIDGNRLPRFTDTELSALKGSADYFGLNHFTSGVARARKNENPIPSFFNDMGTSNVYQSDRWPKGGSHWLRVVPQGFTNYLEWLADEYNNPEIVVYENGYSGDDTLNDQKRIAYIRMYLNALLNAVDNGVNVTGYGVWSLMDSFELSSGFTERFGLYHVDFTKPDLPRTQRNSGKVYAKIAKSKSIAYIDVPMDSKPKMKMF